jgi:hypothetical protein
MSEPISAAALALCQKAARLLTSEKRRAFQAECALLYCQGNARQAEAVFGWGRGTVALGLCEKRSGIACLGNFGARGGKKMEVLCPQMEADIRALADPHSQADPQLKTALAYTRLSGRAACAALVSEKGWREEDLPAVRTMSSILNRLGYRLRAVTKTRPEKNERVRCHLRQRRRAASGSRGGPEVPALELGHEGQRGAGGVLAPGPRAGQRSRGGARP